ncbi:hypothetical protein SASPL_145014 [Salvia splendens]|uniref:Homeobox-leucine zipper protein n=1 Tax=Salvia splendens TaxID=180675 RepID=A0A8X8WGX6_SALSN|nr:hypothetical protein SASPL_145014 [Salvia splendens]
MEASNGTRSGSGDEGSSDTRKGKRQYHRHSTEQVQQLDSKLGLDSKQIKFWFQNKRSQKKAQNERTDNNTLRAENERIRCENMAMREALKNIICPSCRDPLLHNDNDKQNGLLKLKNENMRLRQQASHAYQHERTMSFVTNGTGKPAANSHVIDSFTSTTLDGDRNWENQTSDFCMSGMQETDRAMILEAASAAMDELIELLRVEDPLWISSANDGRSTLHRDSYDKLFPKPNHFKSAAARIESSKESGEVAMLATTLLEAFLDPVKWKDMFPSIMNTNTWAVVDVSYDVFRDSSPSRCWKLPSGCIIKDKGNGKTEVAWVEHVQVDDKSLTHRLYRDLVCGSHAYGAKRWIVTLQRMCERAMLALGPTTGPTHQLEGVIESAEGRRNVMKLSQRMVRNFCEMLNMSDRLDFPHLSELYNSGVRVSLRKSDGLGQPQGLIVSAATSLWLPFRLAHLFKFFTDEDKRAQWDILSSGNPVNSIARISTGENSGNCVSIIQPFVPKENMLMLQESSIDSLGGSIIYAPVELTAVSSVVDGEDIMTIPILPSGYVISGDGRRGVEGSKRSCGSLLTVAFQMLVCSDSVSKQLNMESVATLHSLISSTVQKIKLALHCPDLD